LSRLGFDVSGTVRSSAKADELKNEKINALVYDDSDTVDAVLKAQQKEVGSTCGTLLSLLQSSCPCGIQPQL
jgi:hypothetical protein